ncbi:MAG: rod shape-determining protein MreC [Chloroflexi bacterium]|nr:rod shape-determining protein MreC [Chloroflexota bacterium]
MSDRGLRGQAITFALLVATCLLLLAFSDTKPIQDVRGGVNFALTPIRETLTGGTRAIGSVFDAVAEIDQLRRETIAQRELIARYEEQLLQLPVLQTENQRLAEALGNRRTLPHRTIVADVIYSDPSGPERLIIIDRGTDDGLFDGATVLSAGGSLVGAITELGGNWATVRLITDPRSLVIGRDVRTRVTGEVHGNLSAPLEMKNVPAREDIAVGDVVVTAGVGIRQEARPRFPGGITIGTIVEVDRTAVDITIAARIEPAAHLDGMEQVFVVTDFRPDPLPGATPTPRPTADPDATDRPEPTQRPRRTPRPTPRR